MIQTTNQNMSFHLDHSIGVVLNPRFLSDWLSIGFQTTCPTPLGNHLPYVLKTYERNREINRETNQRKWRKKEQKWRFQQNKCGFIEVNQQEQRHRQTWRTEKINSGRWFRTIIPFQGMGHTTQLRPPMCKKWETQTWILQSNKSAEAYLIW